MTFALPAATQKSPLGVGTHLAARVGSRLLALVCMFALIGCSRGGDDVDGVPEGTGDLVTPESEAPGGDQAEAEAPTPAGDPVAPIEVAPNRDRRPDVEANRDLAQRLGLAPPDPLLVSDLLTRADVRELTNFQGELLETSLAGIAPAPGYNTIRLRADGGYGFALQVWQTDELRQVAAHFRRLRETYFDSALDSSGVGNEAFTADFQGVRHYAFLHRQSKSAAVITCDRTLCDATQIRALAQRVGNRL